MAEFFRVADASELAPGQAKCVEVAGKKIALFNLAGSFYAIDDTCTHRGGPLSEGEVSGEEVTCPWHGAIYKHQDRRSARAACPTRRCAIRRARPGIGRRGRGLAGCGKTRD